MTKLVNLSSIKIFVFDWSGTISDDRIPVYLANMKLLEMHGRPTLTFKEWLRESRASCFELLRSRGVEIDADLAQKLYTRCFDEFVNNGYRSKVYDGAIEVFSLIKRVDKKIFVISTHPTKNLKEEAYEYGLSDFIDFVKGDIKDKAEELKHICERYKVSPQEVLYIGDSIYDIIKLKEANVYSAGICGGYHSRERLEEQNPDFIFENLIDIKNRLNKEFKISA